MLMYINPFAEGTHAQVSSRVRRYRGELGVSCRMRRGDIVYYEIFLIKPNSWYPAVRTRAASEWSNIEFGIRSNHFGEDVQDRLHGGQQTR